MANLSAAAAFGSRFWQYDQEARGENKKANQCRVDYMHYNRRSRWSATIDALDEKHWSGLRHV